MSDSPDGTWTLNLPRKIAGDKFCGAGARRDRAGTRSPSGKSWLRDITVDGQTVKGDSRRSRGILPNPVMLEDTVVGNVCLSDPIGGLNRRRTTAFKHFAWAMYKPGGPVRGWWIRGEWLWIKDRNIPGKVVGFTGGRADPAITQVAPNPTPLSGWYVSTGYKIADSIWADRVPGAFKPFEFTFRYETFQNILVGDLTRPRTRTDVFASQIWTAGINYYIKGHNAKIQLNYNVVNEPEDNNSPARHFREVRNDNLVLNFQVAW